jgi:predicted RND superfamily exporter protein
LLSKHGIKSRAETVSEVRAELAYCQVGEDEILLSGAPVVIAELDRLGSIKANRVFFLSTFLVSAVLLFYVLRDWTLAGGIVAITLWSVVATNCIVQLLGGQMNFILSALPVMVLIFTLSVAVHFIHYYRSCLDDPHPIDAAVRRAFRPCFWATLTTVIGLLSLMVSDIGPVRQFGWAASVGAVVSMFSALVFTPALVVISKAKSVEQKETHPLLERLSGIIVRHPYRMAAVSLCLLAMAGVGLPRLQSHIDPVEFLPRNSQVVSDLIRVENELAPAESIEGIVDFGVTNLPFVEKLQRVRAIELQVAATDGVVQTISLATFFPEHMPADPLETMKILGKASSRQQESDFVSAGQRFWRVSARVSGTPSQKFEIFQRLQRLDTSAPITFTGIAPLMVAAQRDIFDGFWESFATAFGIITLVMLVSLRSIKLALIAMIPNIAPIGIVFGLMGWFDIRVDIGMMMTASIALGIAVDGTFHLIMTYRAALKTANCPRTAARIALVRTGTPIFEAAIIASVGMLVLTLSQFTPTIRFGTLMSTLLATALLGDLLLLPCLLALPMSGGRRPVATESQPTAVDGGHQSRRTAAAALKRSQRSSRRAA